MLRDNEVNKEFKKDLKKNSVNQTLKVNKILTKMISMIKK